MTVPPLCCSDVLLIVRSIRFAGNTHAERQNPLSFTQIDRGSVAANAVDRVIAIAPAPLLPGEEEADYAEVAVRLVSAAKPRDAIEEFLIRDAIDLTWEILRLRRAKVGILKASMNTGAEEVLTAAKSHSDRAVRRLARTQQSLDGRR